MSNPVLVEVTRGPRVESQHSGSLAITRPDGSTLLSMGDIATPVYPRSAVKAFQCIPLIETGAAERFGFGAAELSLACASHSGTPRHADLARSMLTRAHLDVQALGCGAHAPSNHAAAMDLVRAGVQPSQLHNNCSGKHAGMVATATHLGEPTAQYCDPSHPVQARVHEILRAFTGADLGGDVLGVDGCSAPNWAIPLQGLARAYAVFVSGEGVGASHARAVQKIMAAIFAYPELVAGPGRLDTLIMTRFPGLVFMKTGAEGVYCGAHLTSGLGFALKIDDGASRASECAVKALLARLLPDAADLSAPSALTNWQGTHVGDVCAAQPLLRALEALRV